MSEVTVERRPCPVCGEMAKHRVLSREGSHYRFCRKCGLLWRVERQHLEDAIQHYSDNDPGEAIASSKKRLYNGILKRAERISGGPGRLLDVGCGRGAFLDIARARGWEAVGVEPAGELVKLAKARKHTVFQGVLRDYQDGDGGGFDFISYWDVLMMVDDPREELANVRRLLRRDGTAFFRVRQHRIIRLADTLWRAAAGFFRAGNPTVFHPFNFEPRTLRLLFGDCGFNVFLRNGLLTSGDAYSVGGRFNLAVSAKTFFNFLIFLAALFHLHFALFSPTVEVWAKHKR